MPGAWRVPEKPCSGHSTESGGLHTDNGAAKGERTTPGKPALASSWRDLRPRVDALRVTIAPVKLKPSPIPN